MNSKTLSKQLNKLGYNLTHEHYGWLIRSNITGFSWSFNTLKDAHRFMVDEKLLVNYIKTT